MSNLRLNPNFPKVFNLSKEQLLIKKIMHMISQRKFKYLKQREKMS